MNIREVSLSIESDPSIQVRTPKQLARDADALETALADMTTRFFDDLFNGTIGRRHNTYEHRSRILRQMAAELAGSRSQALRSGT